MQEGVGGEGGEGKAQAGQAGAGAAGRRERARRAGGQAAHLQRNVHVCVELRSEYVPPRGPAFEKPPPSSARSPTAARTGAETHTHGEGRGATQPTGQKQVAEEGRQGRQEREREREREVGVWGPAVPGYPKVSLT